MNRAKTICIFFYTFLLYEISWFLFCIFSLLLVALPYYPSYTDISSETRASTGYKLGKCDDIGYKRALTFVVPCFSLRHP